MKQTEQLLSQTSKATPQNGANGLELHDTARLNTLEEQFCENFQIFQHTGTPLGKLMMQIVKSAEKLCLPIPRHFALLRPGNYLFFSTVCNAAWKTFLTR